MRRGIAIAALLLASAACEPAVAPVPAVLLPIDPVCIGVEQSVCLDMARNGLENVEPGKPPIASITVRCTGVCQPSKGAGDSIVVFEDGTNMTSSWAYESVGGGG
jgi:hypothetical protein